MSNLDINDEIERKQEIVHLEELRISADIVQQAYFKVRGLWAAGKATKEQVEEAASCWAMQSHAYISIYHNLLNVDDAKLKQLGDAVTAAHNAIKQTMKNEDKLAHDLQTITDSVKKIGSLITTLGIAV